MTTTMRMTRRSLMLGAAAAIAAPISAAALEALNRPSAGRRHLIMRHATAPGTGDPPDFTLGDCATQRNLSDGGRDQARRIGDKLRTLEITPTRVLSSQWCRCLETARLLDLGPVEDAPALNSFFASRGRADEQTEALRRLLLSLSQDEMTLLVTHQVNITALLDVFPRSGELYAFELDDAGRPSVIDSLLLRA